MTIRKNVSPTHILVQIAKWLFLLAAILFTVYPVLYALLGSLKTNFDPTLGGKFWPKKLMFSNYTEAFTKGDFGRYTLNSVVVSSVVTILSLITASMAGYVFARREFPGKKLIVNLYMAFMFISLGSVTLYPLYMLLSRVGLTQSVLGMALVMTGGQAANVFLINGFIRSVPRELDEAAFIDGCTPFQVFRTMIVPMIRPILAVSLIPALIIYGFTHKQFIAGLTAGAVKG